MRGSGRSGEFDVTKSNIIQTVSYQSDLPSAAPKFRTIISIQPDEQPTRRSSVTVMSISPSQPNGHDVNNEQVRVTEADQDDAVSVASSSASSSSQTLWVSDKQNGYVRSPSSTSSGASFASYRLRTPGSYVSPTTPRRETTGVDEQHRQLVDHPFFAMFRDAPYEESQILSGRGTVRGVRNRVKSGIAVFVEKRDASRQTDYRSAEKGKVLLYTTGVKVVRDTYDKCLRVKKILQTHMVRYEERDISMSRDNHRQLAERLGLAGTSTVELPQVFADGLHIGGANDIERLNESGTLRKIFQHFQTASTAEECTECGGYRYTPCRNCHGSKKSRRNNFTVEFSALRCTSCDDNGLVLCQTCSAAADHNSTDF